MPSGTRNSRSIPPQKVSENKRTKNWYQETIDGYEALIFSEFYTKRSTRTKKKINYELFNGKLNKEDFQYVLNPYGFSRNDFPANLQHYDLISPKLKLLIGEETKRPFNYHVIDHSPDSNSRREQSMKAMLMERLMSVVGNPQPDGNQETPKEVEEYMNTSWKDDEAIKGHKILKYLENTLNLKLNFNEGFKDALISGEEVYWVGERGGEPWVRVCNPIYISIITDQENTNIEDAEAVIEERWMTISSVIDEFHDELSPLDIKNLESFMNRSSQLKEAPSVNYGFEDFQILPVSALITNTSSSMHGRYIDNLGNIRVLRVEWKSFKKVGFIEYQDEMGFTVVDVLSEDFELPEDAYKLDKDSDYQYEWYDIEADKVFRFKWTWINEVHEGTKIGGNIYVEYRAKPTQRRSMDNPSVCKLGYVGKIYDARNSESVSLVERMKSYQYLYNIIYYRTELAFAKAKGKMGIMDLAQMPTSHDISLETWLYYAESMGWIFINSAENNSPGGQANFNQWSEIDLSLGNYIAQHVDFLNKLEEQIGELAGVPRQRLGQVQTSEMVGNTERVVTQSSHITEYWFSNHDEVRRKVMEALLDTTKVTWSKGKRIQYLTDDYTTASMDIREEYANNQYGILVSNSSKDSLTLQSLRSLAEAALRAGTTTFADLVKIYRMDSIPYIEKELNKAQDRAEQSQMQQIEANNAAQKQANEIELMKMDREDANKEADRQLERELKMMELAAKGLDEDEVQEDFGALEDLKLKKDKLEAEKKFKDQESKRKDKELQEKMRSNRENEKLKLKQINKPKPKSN